MALIWSHTDNTIHYEVRSAGNSIRLYSNGVFHSQWNAKRPFAGHIWDLLSLPAFFKQDGTFHSALILGVGGGAAINTLAHFFPLKTITGVDLDPNHLHIARTYFGCNNHNIQLIESEAHQYVTRHKIKYDYIIEDIFIENPKVRGDACRAIKASREWFTLLSERLKPEGILVSNFENRAQLLHFKKRAGLKKLGFIQCYCFASPRYDNAIAVFQKSRSSLSDLKNNLEKHIGDKQTAELLSGFSLTVL